ncbi:MAG: ATP-binding cassette domain-containing protein [Planctomycetota bacterium]|nr:MAG: ATP-binding cassette domain-containing protein [Planctomycetota bacterium]
MTAMIRVEKLTVGWDGRALLTDLNFEVQAGETFAVLGGSGSGKSTVLRHLIGLEVPMAGSIHLQGVGSPGKSMGRPAFGVLFQSGALFGSMTLADNVALPLKKWTSLDAKTIRALVQAKLRIVGLEGYENHLPAEISGGMKKRGGIARALALEPSLLFLDEPSAGLDPVTSAGLDDLILALSRTLGMTTVLVSHELPSILAVADRCILLDKQAGGAIAEGNPRKLRDESSDPRVQAFFHRRAEATREQEMA